ncbi:MAG: flagellar regulator YcgR PilZN domain-containing protein [Deferrisomatales bacterium]|nr:flagellar regulator YcgR PilZN domain-containing protein [Deferrisomatales bacterium]
MRFPWKKPPPDPPDRTETVPEPTAAPEVLGILQRMEKGGVQLLVQLTGTDVYTTEVVGLGRDGFFVDTLSPPEGDRRVTAGARMSFETLLQGVTYTFEAPVVGRVQFVDELPAFKLSYPERIDAEQRRKSPRVETRGDASLSFLAPFPCDAPVVNLSEGGLAFDYGADRGRLRTGTVLRDVLVELGRHPVVAAQGRVVGNVVAELGALSLPSRYRAGLAFQGLQPEVLAVIRAYLAELEGGDVTA